MIRHSKSLLVSLLFHLSILALLLGIYALFNSSRSLPKEKTVCINLNCVAINPPKELQKPIKKEISKPKKTSQKKPLKKEKIVQKKKIEPKLKKVPLQKKKVSEAPKRVKEIDKNTKVETKKPNKPQIEEKIENVKKVEVEKSVKIETPKPPKKIIPKKVKSAKEEYVEKNLQKIVQLLQENLYYPRRARKRGVQGDVVVAFKLLRDATVINIKVLSSQSDILSRAAIKTVEHLSMEFPKPKEDLLLTIPISYRLQ